MTATAVLFWDIDGTLLSTDRAGIYAIEAAAREVCGGEADLQSLPTAGLTDAQIAVVVIESLGGTADAPGVDAFLRVYERELPAALPRRTGRVLPGVLEILDDLAGETGVHNLLLTGNTRAGAAAKLRHYGLDGHLSDGAFCVGAGPRADIAREAWALIAARDAGARLERAYVIGDTPHDVRCGQEIGARTIAVATGGYGLADLQACAPWAAIERLPDPRGFRELVGLPAARRQPRPGAARLPS
ncbi:MAG: phosphoglycolate phosphatase [Solirubrobacteraceae bacterium]|jgi:phosphoglycolate phosphatase-like HAD superfamily hydrolase|nr:phosphoglycolate phosphatase [Solirubrobacteraceae bacterium]